MLCIIGILFGYTIRLYLAHINVILWSLLRLSKIFHSIQIFLRIFAAETAQYDTMALLKFRFAPPKKRSVESRQKSKELGITGEQMAARYLEDQGYVILDRNYYYNDGLYLCTRGQHSLLPLYEGLSRTRERLCILVTGNEMLFSQILSLRV